MFNTTQIKYFKEVVTTLKQSAVWRTELTHAKHNTLKGCPDFPAALRSVYAVFGDEQTETILNLFSLRDIRDAALYGDF